MNKIFEWFQLAPYQTWVTGLRKMKNGIHQIWWSC